MLTRRSMLGYLPLIGGEWLNIPQAGSETEYVRWISLDSPLEVYVDGRTGRGVILR